MGVIIPEDEYQMSMIWTNSLTTKEFTCTIGAGMVTGSPDSPSDVAESIYNGLLTTSIGLCLASNCAIGWVFKGVSGFLQTSSGPVLGSHLDDEAGSGSDNDIPVNCAVLVQKQSLSGGRSNRGRMFLPPMMAGITVDTNGIYGGATPAFIDAGLAQMHVEVLGDGYTLLIHHSDGSPGTPISWFSTQGLFATQRKRMR
jgi:hypothetical protein